MSGFEGLNTSDVPTGSGVITQAAWGYLDRVVLVDAQGREQAAKDHIRIGRFVARLVSADAGPPRHFCGVLAHGTIALARRTITGAAHA